MPPIRSSDYEGRVTALCLFAPADPRSGAVLSSLARAQRDMGPRGVQVIAVACDPDQAYQSTLLRLGLPFPMAFQRAERRNGRLAAPMLQTFQADELPLTLLTDRRRRLQDALPQRDFQSLSEAIRERLAEEPE